MGADPPSHRCRRAHSGHRTRAGAQRAPVRWSHERIDGNGYPDGLRGDEAPLAARIIAAVNAYDAMLREQPYRPARSREEAVVELRRCAGTQFDPAVVAALERFISRVDEPQSPVEAPVQPAATA